MTDHAEVVTFRVQTSRSGRPRYFTVKSYASVEKLREDAARFGSGCGDIPNAERAFAEAVAITHTWDPSQTNTPAHAGIMRLWREESTPWAVAHESLHMALSIYQQDLMPLYGSVHDSVENEERLAYLVGELSQRISDGLARRGL